MMAKKSTAAIGGLKYEPFGTPNGSPYGVLMAHDKVNKRLHLIVPLDGASVKGAAVSKKGIGPNKLVGNTGGPATLPDTKFRVNLCVMYPKDQKPPA